MSTLPKLQCIKATYGSSEVTSKVTTLLAANGGNLIFDSKTDFNNVFGDPEPGKDKLFHMVFRYGDYGAQKSITHAEKHADIYLPALEIKQGQVLTVNVVKAIGLRDTRTLGKQNPYAKLTSGAESFKTKVHEKGGTNAEWNQAFIFNLDGKDQYMHVIVYDKETLSDDVIARFDIPLPTLAAAVGEVAYGLVHPNDFKKSAGSIVLKCEFRDPNAPTIPQAVQAGAAAVSAAAQAVQYAQPTSPQVVYQQPQMVQQQPQVVYVQQPQQPQVVYQQPQMVYQQPQVVYQQQPQVVYQQPVVAAAAPAVVYQQPPQQQIVQDFKNMNINAGGGGFEAGRKYIIKNVHFSKSLSCDGEKIYLSPNEAAWEQWYIEHAGNGKYYIKNGSHNKNLSGHPDKVIGSPNADAWEKWHLKQHSNGHYLFVDHHGKHMSGRDNDSVIPVPQADAWEYWTIKPADGGNGGLQTGVKYIIKNVGLGKHLGLDSDGNRVYISSNTAAWEWWSLEQHGEKYIIKNWTHSKNLSGWPDKVIGSPNADAWEKWHFQSAGNGAYYLRDHHGKYLGGRDNDTVAPTPNTAGWEQWQFIRA